MVKRPFMEMDLEEFEDKNEEVIDEPSLDFDFDEDVEETTSDTTDDEPDTTERKTITVVPQEDVGDVSFGMTRDEVRSIFGDYTEFNKTRMSKSTTDDFGFCQVFYNDNKCEAVELFDTADVIVDGTHIFSSDISEVKSLFPDLTEDGEGLISKDSSVGICISDGKIKSILFGRKGYYDSNDSGEEISSTEDDTSGDETSEIPETPDFDNSDDTETTQESFGFSKLSVSRFYQEEVGENDDEDMDEDVYDDTETSDDDFDEPTDLWDKSERASSYIGKPVTDADITNAEQELGYKLPESYKNLIKQQNGGLLNRCICPTSDNTSWASDHAEISSLFGIDKNKESIFETKSYQTEWGYPDIGLVIGNTPTAGHTMVFLDYRECGHDGEPSVVIVDQEDDYKTTTLANNFNEFINKLVTRDEFKNSDTSDENKYLDDIKSYNDDDPMKELELAVGAKLPKDFAEGVSIFDTNDFSNAKIDHDGETIFQVEEMFSLEKIINTRKNGNFELGDDKLFAIGSDGFGNAIVMNTEDWCYYVWNHETKDTTLIAKTFSDEGIDPGYDITENDTLIGLLENGSNNDNTTDESEEDTETQESFRFNKISSLSRFYQEADEENTDDDDKESSDENNDEEIELPEMPNLDDDEDTNNEDENTDDVDIDKFGMDTSDVQNDYNPKDIESLNKLIAAESEAINDYFDASKDTRDEDLRTLFSDIGHEERFHLEQLMYAKSKLTGEKYEPRDPEVKAEYEELMNGGMDEETAAYTAMDKRSMLGEDDGNDSDMEELEQESAFITNSLHRNEILTSYLSSNIINNPYDISKELGIIVEAFYQEAIDNVSSAPKKYTKLDSPLTILTKGLKVAVDGLVRMSSVVRDSMRKNKLSRARKSEWIKKHGIAELFKSGISLYLYDDNKNKFDLDTPCRYVDFLYRLTKAIGESCGVKLTAAAQHKTISNPIKFNNIKEGMYKLSQVIFNKTKVVVTDDNKAALQNEFFGYSDEKINVKVTHGTDQAINDSGNIYNRLDTCILVTKKYADISIAVLDEMKKLEGDVNSIYYKNRTAYNNAMKDIKTVVDKYTQFISAMSHDLTEIMKIDNGLLKLTRERDMTEQSGGKWEGPDIRVNNQKQSGTQYTKRKK